MKFLLTLRIAEAMPIAKHSTRKTTEEVNR